jgi:hypothetical protein
MRRDAVSKLLPRELVGLSDWAAMGSSGPHDGPRALPAVTLAQQKGPR